MKHLYLIVFFSVFFSFAKAFAQTGCTNPGACNFEIEAIEDDGSCTFPGCTDPTAQNYNVESGCDDGSCIAAQLCCFQPGYSDFLSDCGVAVCAIDPFCCNVAWDGICAAEASAEPLCSDCFCVTPGCTNPEACNYNPNANSEDGSCLFGVAGCIDPSSCAYNSEAICNDNSCLYGLDCVLCNDQDACNYNPLAESNVDCCYEGCIQIEMNDGFGDGWNGGTMIIYNNNDEVVFSGGMNTGLTLTIGICLVDGCYRVEVIGGAWAEEISWIITGTNEGSIAGIAGTEEEFAMGSETMCGCTNPEACNYNANALTDDGTCLFGNACWGCLDPGAVNYDDVAIWDDGSCQYSISAVVFYDANGDQYQDENEPGIGNQAIFVTETGQTIFSDEFGYFYLSDLDPGDYTLNLIEDPEWISTTTTVQVLSVPMSESTILFGLVPAGSDMLFESGTYSSLPIIHCTNGVQTGLYLTNVGESNLTGTLTMTFDDLFVPDLDYNAIEPDDAGSGFASWNILNEIPGSTQTLGITLPGLGVEYLNQTFEVEIHLMLEDGDQVVFENTWTQNFMVACAYDPNDKQAEPVGYAEPHFILQGEEIEYTIRFQNTGNLPAEDIMVQDQLDTSAFDLSSFTPVFSSHPMNTTMTAEGLVEFIFDDIFLPDSTNNEEESHGMIIFEIKVKDDLAPGTVINNFADIYFEQNPPVTTNETWHTIIDCNGFSAPQTDNEICYGEIFFASAWQDYVESYVWTVDGNTYPDMPEIAFEEMSAGSHNISVQLTNPLCSAAFEFVLTVHEYPAISAGEDQLICDGDETTLHAEGGATYTWDNDLGDGQEHTILPAETTTYTVIGTSEFGCIGSDMVIVYVLDNPGDQITNDDMLLIAPDGVDWQWYLNGIEIEGATDQEYLADEEGAYTVLTIAEWGCSTLSNEFLIVSTPETFGEDGFLVYPNPAMESINIFLPDGFWNIELTDSEGRLVWNAQSVRSYHRFNRNQLASGVYYMRIHSVDTALFHDLKIILK